jgi:hypothetical protein
LMDLHHITPRKKTFKSKLAEGKPWLQSLRMKKGLIYVNFLPRGTTILTLPGSPMLPSYRRWIKVTTWQDTDLFIKLLKKLLVKAWQWRDTALAPKAMGKKAGTDCWQRKWYFPFNTAFRTAGKPTQPHI